jgi:hypothetical protein
MKNMFFFASKNSMKKISALSKSGANVKFLPREARVDLQIKTFPELSRLFCTRYTIL